MEKLYELLDRYSERFGEPLPLRMISGSSLEEIEKLVDRCIKDGKPYEIKDDDPNVLY